MLSSTKGNRIYQYIPDYVVFDLETTGTSSKRDFVVEISAVKVKDGIVVDEFTTLVDPECAIPYSSTMIHGITNEMVAQSPCFSQAMKDFLAFAGENTLVGHNIHSFDMKFLYRFSEQYWNLYPDNDYLDTLSMSRKLLPQLHHHTLVDLASYYGISSMGAHRALNDCRMNQKVFEFLGKEKPQPAVNEKLCPRCGSIMTRRHGRFGDFWGCSAFPDCRFTENI